MDVCMYACMHACMYVCIHSSSRFIKQEQAGSTSNIQDLILPRNRGSEKGHPVKQVWYFLGRLKPLEGILEELVAQRVCAEIG